MDGVGHASIGKGREIMRSTLSLGMVLAVVLLLVLAVSPAYGRTISQGQGVSDDVVPGSYIVVLQDGVSPDDVVKAHGVTKRHTYKTVFNGFSGKVPPGQLKKLRDDARVVSVSANHRVQADDQPVDPSGGKSNGKGGKNKPPAVQITQPADGATFASGESIAFAGTATDDKDGDLTAGLAWDSDLEGPQRR